MNEYVLGSPHANTGQITFVCGNDPKSTGFALDDPRPATRFDSPESALAFRARMRHQLGGTQKFQVHELLPDGRVVSLGV
jgi:hypothetical protein